MTEERKSFNASHMFSALPPYEVWAKERVPLLQAFSLALLQTQRRQSSKSFLRMLLKHFRRSSTLYAAECGVYTGAGLRACRDLARFYNIPVTFYGLDSFSGLPDLSDTDKSLAIDNAPYLKRRLFADTSLEKVKENLADEPRGSQKVILYPGYFEDVLPTLPEREYFFVNIDCDLFEGHLQCLSYFYPRIQQGGMIFFDDYHSGDYPMARKAIDEFMRDKPETLYHLRYGSDEVNHTKCFLLKL